MLDEAYPLNEVEKKEIDPGILEARSLVELGKNFLLSKQIDITSMRRRIQNEIRILKHPFSENSIPRSLATREIFNQAINKLSNRPHSGITFVDLLFEINLNNLKEDLINHKFIPDTKKENLQKEVSDELFVTEPKNMNHLNLDYFEHDLTKLASAGTLPTVIGREAEIKSIARIMARTNKRNVILVGEAGVGKTAVVEGFAQWLINEAPDSLKSLRVIQINIADLVANSQYRGQLESRVQNLLSTLKMTLIWFYLLMKYIS